MELIYHYTSVEVLSKILESKKIRFTQIQSLNDKSEYQYGLQLLKNRIIEYEKLNNVKDKFDLSLLDEFSFSNSLCSISFTENGDNYSFWNSYYVPKNGGVAIGFNRNNISDGNFIVNKCIYGNPYLQMKKERYEWFKTIFNIKNILHISKNREYIQITFQTAHIKDKAFIIEDEWRAVSFLPTEDKQGDFIRNGKTVKCFDQFFNIKSISEIIIGPSSTRQQTYNKVIDLITQYGIDCNLLKSSIPLEL